MLLRAINLTDGEFTAFASLVKEKAGINLHSGKKSLVRARLAKRIRELDLQSFDSYLEIIENDEAGDELVHLLDAISTNLTSFFRENNHFLFMIDTWLPDLAALRKKHSQSKRLRVWSAGCSTGEEPYSIAITIQEHSPYFKNGDLKILATDLSTRVLATARQGVYPEERVRDIDPEMLRRYFQAGRGNSAGRYRVKEKIRRLVSFRRFNLMDPFPFKNPLDLIFCRNVMIYFDKKTQEDLVRSFYEALADGGYLLIGHSESLTGIQYKYKYVAPTIYRKQ